jgi:hypothetical protein
MKGEKARKTGDEVSGKEMCALRYLDNFLRISEQSLEKNTNHFDSQVFQLFLFRSRLIVQTRREKSTIRREKYMSREENEIEEMKHEE